MDYQIIKNFSIEIRRNNKAMESLPPDKPKRIFSFLFILKLHATIPPNALTGSHSRAFLNDLSGEVSIDTPDGFACLIITVPVLFNDPKISRPENISL